MIDRAGITAWIDGYERAWRTSGTGGLRELFTEDASYSHSPYADPVIGLDEIEADWEANRDGADEVFTMAAAVVAVEGDTAIAKVFVRYAGDREYLDLWVLRFDGAGRCKWFEEWPFWPDRPWSQKAVPAVADSEPAPAVPEAKPAPAVPDSEPAAAGADGGRAGRSERGLGQD